MTPTLDGARTKEEWDSLTKVGQHSYFFQWEPRKLHFAGEASTGKSVVISIDGLANGWLVGRDNVEITVTPKGAKVRILDALQVSGPVWVDFPGLGQTVQAVTRVSSDTWSFELTAGDPGWGILPRGPGTALGIRIDEVDPTLEFAAYLPRTLSRTNCQFERAMNEPVGLKWKIDSNGRTVTPGEDNRLRLNFNGTNDIGLKRIDIRSEGEAADTTESAAKPFPSFDNKRRAFVDYEPGVTAAATLGYRLLRANLVGQDGRSMTIQASYHIAPPISFEFEQPAVLETMDKSQDLRLGCIIRSNTSKRVQGKFNVVAPEGWVVTKGIGKTFVIITPRGAKRQVFEVTVPAGVRGTFPIQVSGELGTQHLVTETFWLTLA